MLGKRNSLRVAGVALAMLGLPRPADAQFRCVVIHPGETAAAAARRITGNAANEGALWFQIVDPVAARFVPKTEYGQVRAGWRACVSEGTLAGVAGPPRVERPVPPLPPVLVHLAGMPEVWIGLTLLLASMVGWEVARASAANRALARAMTPFGERFVREFEGPLRRPGAAHRRWNHASAACPARGGWRSGSRPTAAGRIRICPITGRTWNTTSAACCTC